MNQFFNFWESRFLETKSLQTMPLSSTSIREGAPRRTVGKLARKKPRKSQHRVQLEKKNRKSSLFRRLSGKRTSNDIIPGSSSQKQTFMPRSASSQDGIQLRLATNLSWKNWKLSRWILCLSLQVALFQFYKYNVHQIFIFIKF